MPPLQPFGGPCRKLILAFDVGTTFSGVAYSLLDPGEVPKIQGVTRFPGQENAAGDSKIPSILYYSSDGTVRAVGAEAALPSMALEAEDEDLIFVEWFKLHLRPDHLDSEEVNKSNIPQLPAGKTVIEVFGDFLAYLFSCAHRYITETHANGDLLWHSVANHIEIVLSHPNGWEGIQQTRMRRAAILGGLVPDTSAGYSRIHFVTEGEASLHFCLRNGLVSDSIKDGESVLIVDAGGGTIDLSTYTFAQVSPLSVEEIVSPDCIMQGSTRVNARAYTFLHDRLRKSAYGNDEDVKTMLDYFEKSTKPIFKDANEPCYIKFGSMSCNDPAVKIRRGQLILSGAEVASFFAPSIAKIVDAIQKQVQEAFTPVTMTFLVGGFASSPWLFSQLQLSLEPLGLCISRPDRHTNKAVAEGAISFYLDSFVSVRVARITYGCECMVLYGGTNPEHFVRRESIVTRPSGRRVLPDAFTVILPKGTRMHDDEEVAHSFFKEASQKSALNKISSEITCYRGTSKDPHWTDIEAEMFSTLCTVYADTSRVVKRKQHGSKGVYYSLDYKVVLLCGLTELKAHISWIENGEEKRGPATIVYDDEPEALY